MVWSNSINNEILNDEDELLSEDSVVSNSEIKRSKSSVQIQPQLPILNKNPKLFP